MGEYSFAASGGIDSQSYFELTVFMFVMCKLVTTQQGFLSIKCLNISSILVNHLISLVCMV